MTRREDGLVKVSKCDFVIRVGFLDFISFFRGGYLVLVENEIELDRRIVLKR